MTNLLIIYGSIAFISLIVACFADAYESKPEEPWNLGACLVLAVLWPIFIVYVVGLYMKRKRK